MIEQEGSSQSIPEGMQYGPFPPPELDSDPVGASWIMKRARGDPTLYQNLMLRESLDTSRREGLIIARLMLFRNCAYGIIANHLGVRNF